MSELSAESGPARADIQINHLERGVISQVLALGWKDFCAAPWFGLFFGLVYSGAGWAIVLLAGASGYYFLSYPLAAGFALIAPFVAAGLYAVSRSLERGEKARWSDVLRVVRGAGSRDLGWMALITGFIFFIWMDIAFFVYAIFFGFRAVGMFDLLWQIVSTWNGVLFFLTGNLLGALIAAFVFSISVVSFPILLDRDIDFVTAMITSVRVVGKNPRVMALWALVIAVLLLVSLLTLLAALVIVLPVLGHASWHMYRRAIARVP